MKYKNRRIIVSLVFLDEKRLGRGVDEVDKKSEGKHDRLNEWQADIHQGKRLTMRGPSLLHHSHPATCF